MAFGRERKDIMRVRSGINDLLHGKSGRLISRVRTVEVEVGDGSF
jgi:hypothetical protein